MWKNIYATTPGLHQGLSDYHKLVIKREADFICIVHSWFASMFDADYTAQRNITQSQVYNVLKEAEGSRNYAQLLQTLELCNNVRNAKNSALHRMLSEIISKGKKIMADPLKREKYELQLELLSENMRAANKDIYSRLAQHDVLFSEMKKENIDLTEKLKQSKQSHDEQIKKYELMVKQLIEQLQKSQPPETATNNYKPNIF